MADVIRKVVYYKTEVPDKPGEGARILSAFKAGGVNMLAFSGFPSGRRAQMDFIPEDEALFKKAAKTAGLRLSPKKTGFLVQGNDRVGAVSGIMTKVAEAKINITALDAIVAGGGRYGVIFWVKPADVRKTAKLLDAK
ncbi:MAG: hypothetical protein IT392_09535 [Nitrospirae bacterium]|nr:hypothetical protein [Nitrospirota bacterium]